MRKLKLVLVGIFLSYLSTISIVKASSNEIEEFTQAELEQILAPIALYPDTILSHILIASTYPIEIIQAERWINKNPDIQGSAAVEAVENKDWDPSVMALVAFPEVLSRLSENLEWTQKLGDAFLQDEKRLLSSVQSLRQKAYESGNLDKMEKVSVSRDDDQIVIEPIAREVVYVPYYDTRVVYGSWRWSHYPPVYWHYPSYVSYYDHHNPFYWGSRINVSFGFFFTSFHWHDHYVVRIPWHRYHPHNYYNRRQIVRHEHATRWSHNPTHRRGVSYRSVTVTNRYKSNRPSGSEIRAHRSSNKISTKDQKLNNNRSNNRISKELKNDKKQKTRIATPNRIRDELRDGKISLKERNSRPRNTTQSNKQRTPTQSTKERKINRKEPNVRKSKPRVQEKKPAVKTEKKVNRTTSSSKIRSSNYRSTDRQTRSKSESSRKSSNNRASSKSRSSHSNKNRDSQR